MFQLSKEDYEVIPKCIAFFNTERLENIATNWAEDERNFKNILKVMDMWNNIVIVMDEKVVMLKKLKEKLCKKCKINY